jgi:acetyl esterase/lipase
MPANSSQPHPTILALPYLSYNRNPDDPGFLQRDRKKLRDFARYFSNLGYPVVIADYTYPSTPYQEQTLKDAFCALAWMHNNAEEYGFDPDKIIVFGHTVDGETAAKLGAVDNPQEYVSECPSTLPATPLAGVITYGGLFFDPADALAAPSMYIRWWMNGHGLDEEMTLDELIAVFERLNEVSPTAWKSDTSLGESDRKIASLLPAYHLDGSEAEFFLLAGEVNIFETAFHGRGESVTPEQSDTFMDRIVAVDGDVQLHRLDNKDLLLARESEVMVPVYEAIKAYLTEKFP